MKICLGTTLISVGSQDGSKAVPLEIRKEWAYIFKKNFKAPFYRWGSTASRLQSHYEEAVYFLPLIVLLKTLLW